MAFCSEDGFMGSRKEDLQTRAINFHIKGARSRELLIHIKRALNSSSFPAHLVIGNQSFPSIWCSGHREVTPVSVPSCCLAVGREGHASEGGTEGWHRAGAQSQGHGQPQDQHLEGAPAMARGGVGVLQPPWALALRGSHGLNPCTCTGMWAWGQQNSPGIWKF